LQTLSALFIKGQKCKIPIVAWLFLQFDFIFLCLSIGYIQGRCLTMTANVLALGAVADFGAQNCQYTTKVDAK